MKIRRTKPTMKQQLFLFFMLAAVLVCLIFSAYYFVSEQRVLRNNLERENTKNLQYAIEKIEENAMRVEEFANQICQNGQIRALMLEMIHLLRRRQWRLRLCWTSSFSS